MGKGLFDYQFYLNESNKIDPQQPIGKDFRIFSEIMDILLDADEKDTVKKIISSKINKIKGFKSNANRSSMAKYGKHHIP